MTDERLEELLDLGEFAKMNHRGIAASHYLDVLREYKEARAEIDRLRKALPHTADGVAIVPGMTLVALEPGMEIECSGFWIKGKGWGCEQFLPEELFATPQAAEAARKAQG